jgi:hypothetical protein
MERMGGGGREEGRGNIGTLQKRLNGNGRKYNFQNSFEKQKIANNCLIFLPFCK